MSRATDLIRVAELIKLAAQTARSLAGSDADGQLPKILDAAQRIEAAAEELARLGRSLEPNGA